VDSETSEREEEKAQASKAKTAPAKVALSSPDKNLKEMHDEDEKAKKAVLKQMPNSV
jgi:hypothetical protein